MLAPTQDSRVLARHAGPCQTSKLVPLCACNFVKISHTPAFWSCVAAIDASDTSAWRAAGEERAQLALLRETCAQQV